MGVFHQALEQRQHVVGQHRHGEAQQCRARMAQGCDSCCAAPIQAARTCLQCSSGVGKARQSARRPGCLAGCSTATARTRPIPWAGRAATQCAARAPDPRRPQWLARAPVPSRSDPLPAKGLHARSPGAWLCWRTMKLAPASWQRCRMGRVQKWRSAIQIWPGPALSNRGITAVRSLS
jgi:hypothetical protein